jgi:hypothetical protein
VDIYSLANSEHIRMTLGVFHEWAAELVGDGYSLYEESAHTYVLIKD